MDDLICQAPNPTCSWGEIKTVCLQRSLGWIEGLSKTFCSASLLWEDYQTQQYANQIMCMNLQAEGMSNVLEHDVSAHREVSKSLRAGTKKGKRMNPQFHSVILKNPCSASVQPGGSQLPTAVTVQLLNCVKVWLLSMSR